MEIPWSTMIDVEWVGQHSFNTVRTVNINTVDLGAAFLTQNQDPTKASATPGAAAYPTEILRSFRGYGSINHRTFNGWRTFHSLQLSLNRRFANGFSFGFNDTWVLYDHQIAPIVTTGGFQQPARILHNADGSFSIDEAAQERANEMFGTVIPNKHVLKGNFVWDLPDLRAQQTALKALGLLINDWQFSGVWTGATGSPYTVGYSYSSGGGNINITGTPDLAGRVRIVGDPGSGCSSDRFRQFNAAAFQGPLSGSDGFESPAGYLRGCFQSILDLSIARNIRMGGARNLQLRVDMFNAPNQAIVTNRNTTMNLASTADPVTVTNLPYDAQGNILPNRIRPASSGFGQATAWQTPRQVQVQVKFSF
jgi:hypothetical protein